MSDNAPSAGNQQETTLVKPNLINHKWGILRDYTPDISRSIDKKMASLLAILFTDATVSPKYKNSWRILFGNTSQVLIDLFTECMRELFQLNEERVKIRMKKDGFWIAIVNSKAIGDYLTKRFGNFRTLRYKNGEWPKAKLPLNQLIRDNVAVEFLKVAFSCDGGLCFYPAKREGRRGDIKWLIRTIFLSCSHPGLREDYLVLLKSLGIQARNVLGDGKIKIEKERDIRQFAKKIGFVKGVKVTGNSKFWKGYEKQQVLNLMISSYENPSCFYNLSKFLR